MQVIINNILFLYFASLVLTQTWTTFESKNFSKLETFMVLPLTYSTAMLIISHRQKLQRFYIFFYILVNKAVGWPPRSVQRVPEWIFCLFQIFFNAVLFHSDGREICIVPFYWQFLFFCIYNGKYAWWINLNIFVDVKKFVLCLILVHIKLILGR